MLICGVCGMKFNDKNLDEYTEHVQACGISLRIKERIEKIKRTSERLEELKTLEKDFKAKELAFKTDFPDVYDEFFLNSKNIVNFNSQSENQKPIIILDLTIHIAAD